jgi:hypothetical protein
VKYAPHDTRARLAVQLIATNTGSSAASGWLQLRSGAAPFGERLLDAAGVALTDPAAEALKLVLDLAPQLVTIALSVMPPDGWSLANFFASSAISLVALSL